MICDLRYIIYYIRLLASPRLLALLELAASPSIGNAAPPLSDGRPPPSPLHGGGGARGEAKGLTDCSKTKKRKQNSVSRDYTKSKTDETLYR